MVTDDETRAAPAAGVQAQAEQLRERVWLDGEYPPDSDTGYVACRQCGWYGEEAHTTWTDSELRDVDGEGEEDAELSCPKCHSSNLRDAFEPAPPAPPEREGERRGACGACDGFGVSHAGGPNQPYPCEVCGGSGTAPLAPAQAEALPADVEREDEARGYSEGEARAAFRARVSADVPAALEGIAKRRVGYLAHGEIFVLQEACARIASQAAEIDRLRGNCDALLAAARGAAVLQRSSQVAPELAKSAPAGDDSLRRLLGDAGQFVAMLRRATDAEPLKSQALEMERRLADAYVAAPAPQPETGALEAPYIVGDITEATGYFSPYVVLERFVEGGEPALRVLVSVNEHRADRDAIAARIASALNAAALRGALRAAPQQTEVEHG